MSQEEIEVIPEVAQPSVPWTILDVVLFFVLWLVAQIAVGIVVGIVIVVTHSPGDRVQVAPSGGRNSQRMKRVISIRRHN